MRIAYAKYYLYTVYCNIADCTIHVAGLCSAHVKLAALGSYLMAILESIQYEIRK